MSFERGEELDTQFTSVPVTYTFEDILDLNEDLAKGKLRVAYTGQNRNGSYIGKAAFENAVGTLAYKPVVAHYIPEKEDFGGHDGKVVETPDGDVAYVNITEPVGVIPENTKWCFETAKEDGIDRNYFTIEVILWKRQRAYELIKAKPFTKHSMEIEVLDGHMENGFYQIDAFRFLAFCLLGEDVEPCFEGSKLQLFEVDAFQKSITEFVETIRKYHLNTSLFGSDIHNEGKEEVEPMEKEMEMATEPEVSANEPAVEESGAEPETLAMEPVTELSGENFELTSNLMSQIQEGLCAVTVEMEWGAMCRYWYVDTDFSAQMVYCFDMNDDHLYGLHYDLNGDVVSIDFDSCKRMKFAIVEFADGDENLPLQFVADMCKGYTDEIAEMRTNLNRVTAELADTNELYDALKVQNENLTEENTTLTQFKRDAEFAQAKAEKEALFVKWEALIGETEKFSALREQMDNYEIAALETELKCIFADTKADFALKSVEASKTEKKTTRIPMERKVSENVEDYGGLYSKYGVKPIRE